MSLLTVDLYAAPEDLPLSRSQQSRLQSASAASKAASNLHRAYLDTQSHYDKRDTQHDVLLPLQATQTQTQGRRPSVGCLKGLQTPPLSSAASSRRSSLDRAIILPEAQMSRRTSITDDSIPEEVEVAGPSSEPVNKTRKAPWRERLVDLILDRYAQCSRKIPPSVTERHFFKACCEHLKRLDGVANAREVAELALAQALSGVIEARARCGARQAVACGKEAERIHAEADALPSGTASALRFRQEEQRQEEREAMRLLQRAEYELELAKVVHCTYVKRLQD